MIKKENIKTILEYVLLVFLFFIGIKKGGYYKQDELILVYLVQVISGIFFILNIKSIKSIKITDILFLIFSLSYFLSLFFIPATMSGALNVVIKVYTMFLLYCVVSISKNKEKYVKAIVIFTVIFSIIGIDEIGARILDKPLKLIGSGYLEYEGKISSVFQYSNLLGILCVISIVYLKDKLFKRENELKISYILINVCVLFLGLVIILTQSKMALFLYVISSVLVCIFNKKYKDIIKVFFDLIYSFILSILIMQYNVYAVLILGLIIYFGANYLINIPKLKNISNYIVGIFVIASIIFFIFNTSILDKSGVILKFKEYFTDFDSTISRFTYYVDALKLSTSSITNFLFGTGGNGFRTLYETVQQQQYISMEVHSIFIQILVESGVIGLISFLILTFIILKNGKNNIYKFIIVNILVFSCFDVYFTYTYMLFILSIFIAVCCESMKEIKLNKIYLSINIVVFTLIFVINTSLVIGYIIEPIDIANLNNSLEEQQKVINKCDLALKFDRYDLDYISNYNVACNTYIQIMDIKKELYGQDDEEKRKEIISIIENNLNSELKYEKSNKYVYRDYIYYICEYLDYVVQNNYSNNIKLGYEIYLDNLLNILERLRLEHSNNDFAMQVYNQGVEKVYYKYSQVNLLINSDKINSILTSIEENISISL